MLYSRLQMKKHCHYFFFENVIDILETKSSANLSISNYMRCEISGNCVAEIALFSIIYFVGQISLLIWNCSQMFWKLCTKCGAPYLTNLKENCRIKKDREGRNCSYIVNQIWNSRCSGLFSIILTLLWNSNQVAFIHKKVYMGFTFCKISETLRYIYILCTTHSSIWNSLPDIAYLWSGQL